MPAKSDNVRQWLEQIGLEQYGAIFVKNDIDWALLSDLDNEVLKDIGITSAGHRLRILKAAKLLDSRLCHQGVSDTPGVSGDSDESDIEGSQTQAERRQLTVMFCDLVGSTALSQKLDPEAMRDVMQAYQQACGRVIARYDGHVAQYLGDGLMTYFGWPRAHEDSAERAIRTGLDIIDALRQVPAPEPLQVRVGIATGEVVVGETGEGDASVPKLAVGDTPNLAARVQRLARANQIVISPGTRQLVGGTFEIVDLGNQVLKGIVEPVRVWRVTGLAETEGRFDAAHGETKLTPVVGRQDELDMLLSRWQLAQESEGQVVLLSGEPGIGKSRLTAALREHLQSKNVVAMRFQCSSYHVNSPFWPSIENFKRILKLAPGDSAESKLDKIEALMVGQLKRPLTDVRFIAAMLSISCEQRYGELAISPQKFKDETQRTLVDLIEAAANQQPSVLLFEDAHWADPSTLEVLDLLIDRVKSMPLLIVITYRPEFESTWGAYGHVKTLDINKLNRAQSRALVSQFTQGKVLPSDLLEQILVKTDGVPLFIEELTQSILESGKLSDQGDHYGYTGGEHQVTIPATLRDSLMSRLDRYWPVREIAQIGAAIGREFSYELILAVAPAPPAELDRALSQLTDSGLAFRNGTPPDAVYTFKHALVRDSAYDSLLKSRRVGIHDAIFEQLAAIAGTAAETLAHHAMEAGRYAEAVDYWEKAGDQAFGRPAYSEAIHHFERAALAAATRGNDSPDNDRELSLRVKHIRALQARWGYDHRATVAAIESALALLDVVGQTPHRYSILSMAATRYLVGTDFSEALSHTEAMVAEAERTGDAAQQSQAYNVRGMAKKQMGAIAASDADFGRSLACYEPEQHSYLVLQGRLGHHVGMARQCQWAQSLVLRGEAKRAWAMVSDVPDGIRKLAHGQTLGNIQLQLAVLHQLVRSAERERETQKAIDVAIEFKQAQFRRGAERLMAVGQHDDGNDTHAIDILERQCGLKPRPEGNRSHSFLFGLYYATYAASLAGVGRLGDARRIERHVISMLIAEPRNWLAAEAYRLLAQSNYQHRNEVASAIKWMERSLAIAQDQGAELWRLRTTVSLARLRADQGERAMALDLLKPAIDQFPAGGRDLADLAIAKSLLQDLL